MFAVTLEVFKKRRDWNPKADLMHVTKCYTGPQTFMDSLEPKQRKTVCDLQLLMSGVSIHKANCKQQQENYHSMLHRRWETRYAYKTLVRKPEGKRRLERSRRR